MLQVNAGLTVLWMLISLVYLQSYTGAEATLPVTYILMLSSLSATWVLGLANLLIGFFVILGTATLDRSEVRGYGKGMLLNGLLLVPLSIAYNYVLMWHVMGPVWFLSP